MVRNSIISMVRDIFSFGKKDITVDDIDEKIDMYENRKKKYEKGLRQLRKGVKKIEAINAEEWIRYNDRHRIAEYKGHRENEMLFIMDRFMKRHYIHEDILEAVDEAFTEFDPASSEKEKEAEIRSSRVKQALSEMADKIENKHLPRIEEKLNEFKRMKHEIKAGKDFKSDKIDDNADSLKPDLLRSIPESEYDPKLNEIMVEKEMEENENEINSLMSLEEIAYFIAEDMRNELDRNEYDIEFIIRMEERYPKHVEEVRKSITPTEDENEMKKDLKNLHQKSEHIGPLKSAHVLYMIGRIYEGRGKKSVDELRTFT